jgi:hypothetical protein
MGEGEIIRQLQPHEVASVQPFVRELEIALMEERRSVAKAAQRVAAARMRLGLVTRVIAGPSEEHVGLDPERMVLLRVQSGLLVRPTPAAGS